MRQLLLVVCLALGIQPVLAQVDPFVGTWTVTWQDTERSQEATLVVTESGGGSWRTLRKIAAAWADPCIGRQVPISVVESGTNERYVWLKFDKALQGCRDATIRLRLADDGSVTGLRGQYRLTLKRQ
jgi:hypothetical protein